ncbi:MAG: hypothetical protein OEZ01_03895 [Candidatus Heimdallarchaeota archaeon]|nr:hypothetical protein [Candidatus Heimdallarchaeota archaeon]MDH5645121.1 hypothetical protein [Candidatus Heimdallarchaeota archaeon]
MDPIFYFSVMSVTFFLFILEIYFAFKLIKIQQNYPMKGPRIFLLATIIGSLSSLMQLIYRTLHPNAIEISETGSNDIILGIISAYFVLVFLNYYEESHLDASKMIITTILGLITIFSTNEDIIAILFEINVLLGIATSLSVMFFFLYILIVGRNTIKRMMEYATSEQKKSINLVKWYIYLSFGGVTIVYFTANMITSVQSQYNTFSAFWTAIMPQIMIIFANMCFYFGYIKPGNPASFQPQRIDKFVLISEAGLPIYTFDVEKDVKGIDDALLSGAITAIAAVLREATNIVGELKTIEIGSQSILLRKKGDLTGVLFSYLPTQFLRQAVSLLMDKLTAILDSVDYTSLTTDQLNEIEQLIKNTLGY